MPGGGCVLLIPYLISRSRGEALNPKHTHIRSLIVGADTYTHMQLRTQAPTSMHMPTCMFTFLSVHYKVLKYTENCSLICKCFKPCIKSMAPHVHYVTFDLCGLMVCLSMMRSLLDTNNHVTHYTSPCQPFSLFCFAFPRLPCLFL